MGAKKLRNVLPTRRKFVRDLGIGTVLAGVAGFAAADLFPAEAHESEGGEGLPAMAVASAADIARVTANGAIVLGPLGSRNLGTGHRLLSGEDVTVRVPAPEEVANSTASILGYTTEGTYGFQATQQGFGLYGHAPGFELDLNGTVTLQGGTLAHYTIRNRTIGSRYLTLWQGDHHDLYTYIPDSLTEAIGMLSVFDIDDSDAGLSLSPKAGSRAGHSVQESNLLVEFGDYLADVQRVDDATPPSWPGRTGIGGDFYADDDGVLFVSETAAVTIRPWRGDTVAGSDLDGLVAGLRIDIGPDSGAVGNVDDPPGGGQTPGAGPGDEA